MIRKFSWLDGNWPLSMLSLWNLDYLICDMLWHMWALIIVLFDMRMSSLLCTQTYGIRITEECYSRLNKSECIWINSLFYHICNKKKNPKHQAQYYQRSIAQKVTSFNKQTVIWWGRFSFKLNLKKCICKSFSNLLRWHK